MIQNVTEGMKNLETRFNRLEQQQGIQPPPAVAWQPDSTSPNVYNRPSSVPTGNGARGNNGERPGTLGLHQWRNGYEGESPRQLSRRDGPYYCFQCGQPGHFKRNCPYQDDYNYSAAQSFQPSRQGTNSGNGRRQYQARGIGTKKDNKKVYLKVSLGHGQPKYCLLDSGSEISLIPSECVGQRRVLPTTKTVWAANGTSIPVAGWTELSAFVGDTRTKISGFVTDYVKDVFLGLDWLQDNNVQWNFGSGGVVINGARYRLVAKKSKADWCRRVIVEDDVVVPPRSQCDLRTKAVFGRLPLEGARRGTWATEPHQLKEGLLVAGTLLPDRVTDLPVRVLNVSNRPVSLHKRSTVSKLAAVTTEGRLGTAEDSFSPENNKIIEEMVSRVSPDLPDSTKGHLRQLLRKYNHVFSKNENDLGWTDLVTHTIDTGDSRPIRQQLRRHPPAHQEEIDKQVSDFLERGVVESASSPWSSNVVLARKSDGTWRCCIDFRQLNAVTRKDAYPLPKTDQCFDALAGSCLFSLMDLRSGYHQCALAPEDADKTAFVTRKGRFRFKVLPFGLTNAVATFQRLMDLVLSGLNFEVCLVYVDDVIVFSTTPEQHLERLEMVLKRFQDANLKLKPSKCHLMQAEICFLGHRVVDNKRRF